MKGIFADSARRRPSKLPAYLIGVGLLLALTSCSKDPEAVRVAAIEETYGKLSKCAPANADESDLKLAVVSAFNEKNETLVRLVAYAINSPAEFALPAYRLSSGRWLIGEKDRAYLLDEHCREFKLKDRKVNLGQTFPQDGMVKLNPGQAFEITMGFHRLPDRNRIGVLVYAGRSLPFTISQPLAGQTIEVESK